MPKFGIASPEECRELTGLEFIQGILNGDLPHPPIAEILGYRLAEVSEGRVVFSGHARKEYANPMGTMHGGWYGTLLDSAMACAVMTKAGKGQQFTTLEYKVNLTKPFPICELAYAEGSVLHFGRRTATAEAKLLDAEARQYAFATTTCMLI